MKSVWLTRSDGTPIYFGHGFIVAGVSGKGREAEGARSEVTYNGSRRFLREDVCEAASKIEAASKE